MRFKKLFPLSVLILISVLFFYKLFLYGSVPIPGDLLIAEYGPWKYYSYLGYNPGSFPNKAQYFDVLRQLYPWKTVVVDLLKVGEIPFWNPYNFSGSPLLANFQSAVFYPFNFIYFIFSQVTAWSVLVFLQPLLASVFTYFYARKIGISKIGAIFSSIAFSCSSFLSVWLEYNTIGNVILWLPLTLLCVEQIIKKRSIVWSLIFVFSLVSSVFAGHPQIFFYLLSFVFVYSIIRSAEEKKRHEILYFLILIILSLGIGAIQLFPGIELVNNSARSPHDYNFFINKILIQPWQLIMLFIPDFFGNPATRNYWLNDTYVGKVLSIGIIPLIFVSIVLFFKKNNFIKLFLTTAIIILFFVTWNPLTIFLYKIQIPIISASSPTLSIFLFCFSLSVLSGFGVDIFKQVNFKSIQFLKYILPLILIFLTTCILTLILYKISFLSLEHFMISLRNLFYVVLILFLGLFLLFVAIKKPKTKYFILILLLVLNIFDLWRSFEKFNPFVPNSLVFPKVDVFDFLQTRGGIDRFVGYKAGSVEANFATQYSLYSPDGYDPLYSARYGEFINLSKNGKIGTAFDVTTRSDAVISQNFDFYQSRVIDLLGVKYVLDRFENGDTQKVFPESVYQLIYNKDGWRIFQNTKALPRFFFASEYFVFKNADEFQKKFISKETDLSKTILLEKNPKVSLSKSQNSELKLISYSPNKIIFMTKTDGNKLLFISDNYYPGWKAFIDGDSTTIFRADYSFRSIVIPKGEHRIVFTFYPDSFRIGLMTSILSSFLLICFLALKSKFTR